MLALLRSLRPCGSVHKLGLELRNPGLELPILRLKFVILETLDEVTLLLELVCEFSELGIGLVLNLAAIELAGDVSEEMCNLEHCCLVSSLGLQACLNVTPSFELLLLFLVLHSEHQLCCCFN